MTMPLPRGMGEAQDRAVAARTCPVCDGREFAPMFRRARAAAAHYERVPYRITQSSRALVDGIERCRGCGLGMLPPELIVADHYAEGADELFAEQAPVRIRNAERLLRVLGCPAGSARLLDVGSAYGFLLVAARRLGYTPMGVEPSQAAAAHARRTYELSIFGGRVEEAPFEEGSFDVITLADVIEHLSDPAAVIRRVHGWLRPGGRLLILTPDLGSLAARLLGRHWWALLDDHYVYFSRRTLSRFLDRHGFVTERLQSLGRAFPVQHWVYKLSQYSGAIYGAVDSAVRLVGIGGIEVPLNFGDQMVCIARRPESGVGER
jgi:2-polyprenyl-3-methyl-5-hydroxy-6-metoxy-1,4-benzoquinol methylase